MKPFFNFLMSKQTRFTLFKFKKSMTMSKTATIALVPSSSLFGRLFAALDRLLLNYAEMTIRNGDVPRSGV